MKTLEERLHLIQTMVEKDVKLRPWALVAATAIAGISFFFMLPVALSSARFPFAWTWFDGTLRPFYGIYAALTSLILGLTFATFHAGEIRRGTIRSIILYPVDMNDITIAKLLSSLVVTTILSTILFIGVFGSFFLLRVFPAGDFLAIHVTALAMSFMALAVGVFLAQGLAHLAGRMLVSPAALGAIFLLLAIVFTETALTFIGTQIASLSAETRGRPLTFEDLAVIQSIARDLSVLSPHHVGGRILGIAFGITRMWADIHVVVPLAALVVTAGYAFGRKLYLDIFIR